MVMTDRTRATRAKSPGRATSDIRPMPSEKAMPITNMPSRFITRPV